MAIQPLTQEPVSIPSSQVSGMTALQASVASMSTSMQGLASKPLWVQAASATNTNSNAQTDMMPSPPTVPANTLAAGKMLRFDLRGLFNVGSVVTQSMTARVKLGSTIIGSGSTTAINLGATNVAWYGFVEVRVPSAGNSVVPIVGGSVLFTLNNALVAMQIDGNGNSIDTTQGLIAQITSQWGNSTANDSLTSRTGQCSLVSVS